MIGKLVPTFYGIPFDRKVVVVVLDISSSVRRFGDGPARAALEEALALMETTTDLPREVRQNYQMTLDGVHAIQAQYRACSKCFSSFESKYPNT